MELYKESEGVPLVDMEGQVLSDTTGLDNGEIPVLTEKGVAQELGHYLVESCVECAPRALARAKDLVYWLGVGRIDYTRATALALVRVCWHPRQPFEFATPDPRECGVVVLSNLDK
jgi:hypothetical protein